MQVALAAMQVGAGAPYSSVFCLEMHGCPSHELFLKGDGGRVQEVECVLTGPAGLASTDPQGLHWLLPEKGDAQLGPGARPLASISASGAAPQGPQQQQPASRAHSISGASAGGGGAAAALRSNASSKRLQPAAAEDLAQRCTGLVVSSVRQLLRALVKVRACGPSVTP